MDATGHDLEAVIHQSPIDVVTGPFLMLRLPSGAAIPPSALCTFRDATELTVVVPAEDAPALDALETAGPFALLRARVAIPFVVEGFLAAMAGALAARGLNVLLVSTFSYDYAFVDHDALDEALAALGARGFPAGTLE